MAVADVIVDTLEDVHNRMTVAGSTMGEAHALVAEVLGTTISMNAANLALVEGDMSAFDAVMKATDAARDAWSPLWREQCRKQLAAGRLTDGAE
jgi:hypothetical protein